jgi:hypothetical protein
MDSPKSVSVQIYSITGALVASYYNNTERGENLQVVCSENKIGGLDKFSFTIPSTTTEPLFTNMECRIFVDGVHWFTGFADVIPDHDTDEPTIDITGLGYVHKLKEKTINRSYTAQSLDYIAKDIAANELGADVDVYYLVSNFDYPGPVTVTIEFEDQSLYDVFEQLLLIYNKDYASNQFTWGVDKDKRIYITQIQTSIQKHLFEGYNYQTPEVDKVSGKIINKYLAYRTTLADNKSSEYVATYSDTDSLSRFGTFEKKITFPNYVDTTTIASICNGLLEKNAIPKDRVSIKDLEVDSKLPIDFYALSNRRENFFITIEDMEDILNWDTSGLFDATASINETQVMTGRRAMRIVVTGAGAKGTKIVHDLPVPIRFPNIFRSFVYLTNSTDSLIIRLIDSRNNTFDITFEGSTGEWLKILSPIPTFILDRGEMIVDYDGSNSDFLTVDFDGSNSDDLIVNTTLADGLTDIVSVEIEINTDTSTTMYVDALSAKANSFSYRSLILESVEYRLGKSYVADAVFGSRADSIIDEIKGEVKDGNIALSIYSKQ